MGCSPVQLRLVNQSKVQPIGWVMNLLIYVEGMRTYADLDVIEFINGEGSYHALWGIGWANDSMAMINLDVLTDPMSQLLKIKKVNIGTDENPKFANVGDY